ncbi:MAG TPA: hypothetical protein VHQ65_04720 [Thermoanaerobaculia bacterium]|nr:hypothetical protein [Thermoanaerobaculia bacterium]
MAGPRLLILSAYRTERGFREFQAARVLLAALDARGVRWRLGKSDDAGAAEELAGHDAVLCWTFRHTWGNHLFHAARLEERCAELGIPVVNPVATFTYRHSADLERWSAAGVPCPRHQRFTRLAEVALGYPLVLRRDGEHRGRRMVRVERQADAPRLLDEANREDPGRPLDLALELVDTRWPDGFYRKRRAYVVGGEVIPAHAVRSEHWIVNFGHRRGDLASWREDRAFLAAGEPRAGEIRTAVAVLGADVAAVDYSPAPDGRLVFWEANRNPRMWGDRNLPARPRAPDHRFGEALAELVLRRVAEAGR